MKKAVIFDWGGVLIDNPEEGLLNYWAQHLEVPIERLKTAKDKHNADFQRGRFNEADFWYRICNELDVPVPQVHSLFGDSFKAVYQPKDEMFELVESLRGNHLTCLLSNTEMPAVAYFGELGYKMFDQTVFSCVEGFIKPERWIYEIALSKLSVSPDETIFVDDKVEYLAGASALGIEGILFENPAQVKNELKRAGIKIKT